MHTIPTIALKATETAMTSGWISTGYWSDARATWPSRRCRPLR
jgi:hypothetical protein